MKRSFDESAAAPATGAPAIGASSIGQPAAEYTMRMLLFNQHAGTFIGKGGANVKAVREASNCKININEPSVPGGERLVTISGAPLSINHAIDLILSKIEALKSPGEAAVQALAAAGAVAAVLANGSAAVASGASGASAADGGSAGDGAASSSADGGTSEPAFIQKPMQHSLKMSVSNQQIGALIGKGGSQIREFREGSGAQIKVEPPPPGQQLEWRSVTISGSKTEVVRAHQLVITKLASMPEDEGRASKFARQAPAPGAPAGYGAAPSPYAAAANPYAVGLYGYAPPPPGQYGQPMPPMPPAAPGSSAYLSYAGYSQPPPVPMPASSGPHGGGAVRLAPPMPTGGPDGETIQLVPSSLAGRLIGKGGSGIRELRESSRAQVKILADCEPGTDLRRVTVTGAPEAVQAALALIHAKLMLGP